MRTVEIKIYTISDHPNKEKCFDWIRENWHDLNIHSVCEVVQSINALNKIIGGTCEYSVGQFPDRDEHIMFTNYDQDILSNLNADDCPLTGVCWDIDLIKGLQEGNTSKVLESLHEDSEYTYSNEGLQELCEANEYEFTEDGEVY